MRFVTLAVVRRMLVRGYCGIRRPYGKAGYVLPWPYYTVDGKPGTGPGGPGLYVPWVGYEVLLPPRLRLVLVALWLTSLVAGDVPLGLTPFTLLLYLLRMMCSTLVKAGRGKLGRQV